LRRSLSATTVLAGDAVIQPYRSIWQTKKIWSEIDPLKVDQQKTFRDTGIYSSITEHGTEFLIHWLSNRTNFEARDWTKVWHHVNGKTPFDDRLVQVALDWIFYNGSENLDLQQSFSLVYVLLDRWKRFGYELPELGEFLSDRLTSDFSILFEVFRHNASSRFCLNS